MMKLINYKTEKGFIILDSLVATVILGVALVALAGLVTMGVKTANQNNQQMIAYKFASAYGDALQSLGSTNWNTQVTSATYNSIDLSSNNTAVYDCLSYNNYSNIITTTTTGRHPTTTTTTTNDLTPLTALAQTTLPGATVAIYGKQSRPRLVLVKIVVTWNPTPATTQSVQLLRYYVTDILQIP